MTEVEHTTKKARLRTERLSQALKRNLKRRKTRAQKTKAPTQKKF